MAIGYTTDTTDDIVTETTTKEDLELTALFSNGGEIEVITNMDGIELTVDYYKQMLGVNDLPKPHDVNTPAALQSYGNISDLILYLDSPLDPTDGDYTTLNGSAKFSTNMIPVIGDLFTTIVQGRLAVFNITKVSKATFNNVYVFKIDFIFSYFKDTDVDRYGDLSYKVAAEDIVLPSTGEIVATSTYTNINKLLPLRKALINNLLENLLYDTDTNLFVLPTVEYDIVDFNLLKYLSAVIDVNEHPLMLNINDVTIEEVLAKDTIFDMILDTRSDTRFLNRNIGPITYTPDFTVNYTFNAKYYQLDYTVGNLDPLIPSDVIEYKAPVFAAGSTFLPEREKDENYIFNNEFYIATEETYDIEKLDKVELLVYDFINSKATNITSLIELMEEVRLWDTYRQVYYSSILIGIATTCLNKYKVL